MIKRLSTANTVVTSKRLSFTNSTRVTLLAAFSYTENAPESFESGNVVNVLFKIDNNKVSSRLTANEESLDFVRKTLRT